MEDTFNGHASISVSSIHRAYLLPSGKNKLSIKSEKARDTSKIRKNTVKSSSLILHNIEDISFPLKSFADKDFSSYADRKRRILPNRSKTNEFITFDVRYSIKLILPRIQTSPLEFSSGRLNISTLLRFYMTFTRLLTAVDGRRDHLGSPGLRVSNVEFLQGR